MDKKQNKIKDLKNIKNFGYEKLTIWGIFGAAILFIWSIVSIILSLIINWNGVFDDFLRLLIIGLPGLILGIMYSILGIFGIIRAFKNKKGKYWWIFLTGSILAILSPLSWFGIGGLIIAILAGLSFYIFFLLEKK